MTISLCPRCNKRTLKGNGRDALSRRAAIGICSECGTDEAMIDYALSNTKNKSQFCIEIAFLLKIIEMGIDGKIDELVIVHKDRLARFGYDLIEFIIKMEEYFYESYLNMK